MQEEAMSPAMEMLLVIGGLAFVFASASAVVVMRTLRRSQLAESKRHEESQRLKEQEARRRVEEETRLAAEHEAQRKAEEERSIAAAQEVKCKAEAEARLRLEEEARAAVAQESKRRADEEARLRFRAEEAARAAAQEAQRKAEEEANLRAKEETRVAAAQEAQRKAEEQARRRTEEEARVAAEQDAQRRAEAEDVCILAAHASEETRTNEARALAMGSGATSSSGAAPEHPAITQIALDVATGPVSATVATPAPDLRAPRQYRPLARVPAALRDAPAVPPEREARERAMPIEVRLVFEKAGFCRVSLLPRRAEGMPTEWW